ncbi:uncharacterized protein LOC135815196 [Sycon ciliatum]|uniref:uncharacterized protein LOC135815196 n=1 Tax=Sycon ciliatum TaxID=27933 RepID=UPI0031F6FC22
MVDCTALACACGGVNQVTSRKDLSIFIRSDTMAAAGDIDIDMTLTARNCSAAQGRSAMDDDFRSEFKVHRSSARRFGASSSHPRRIQQHRTAISRRRPSALLAIGRWSSAWMPLLLLLAGYLLLPVQSDASAHTVSSLPGMRPELYTEDVDSTVDGMHFEDASEREDSDSADGSNSDGDSDNGSGGTVVKEQVISNGGGTLDRKYPGAVHTNMPPPSTASPIERPCRPDVTQDSIVKLLTDTPRAVADQFITTVSSQLLSDTASSRVTFRYHMNELQAFSMIASECFTAALRADALVDFIEPNDIVPLIQSLVNEARLASFPSFFLRQPRLPPFYVSQLRGLGKKRKRRGAATQRRSHGAGHRLRARQSSQTCARDTNVQDPLARINFRQLTDARDRPIYDYEENAGQGVVAYVVDTGVFGDSTDFTPGSVERGVDAASVGGDPFVDSVGHGTHVAGIIGSRPFGVAKSVTMVAVKVFNDTDQTTDASVIAGLNYIFDDVMRRQQPSVINLSLGARGNGTHRVLNMAVECLIKAGVVVVAAAGNENEDACQSSPALLANVITVGNVDNNDVRHANSSFGSCVDIFAPGVNSVSTGRLAGSFRLRNGTSVSAAFVSGVVARLLAICPSASPSQVKDFLLKSSTKNVLFSLRGSPNRLLFIECTDQLRTCQDLGVSATSP